MSAGEEQRRPPAMHLEVTGSGPAVVLTHSFADDSTTFDALAAASDYSPTASSWTGCRPSSCRSSSWSAATIGATTPAAG